VNATQYHNSPIKTCQTCVHRVPSQTGLIRYDYCARLQRYCVTALNTEHDLCGKELKYWQPQPPKPPKPKRRSLLRWLRDLLWA
jgi:hypothetical protein